MRVPVNKDNLFGLKETGEKEHIFLKSIWLEGKMRGKENFQNFVCFVGRKRRERNEKRKKIRLIFPYVEGNGK